MIQKSPSQTHAGHRVTDTKSEQMPLDRLREIKNHVLLATYIAVSSNKNNNLMFCIESQLWIISCQTAYEAQSRGGTASPPYPLVRISQFRSNKFKISQIIDVFITENDYRSCPLNVGVISPVLVCISATVLVKVTVFVEQLEYCHYSRSSNKIHLYNPQSVSASGHHNTIIS